MTLPLSAPPGSGPAARSSTTTVGPVETAEETALAAEITCDPPAVRADADAFLLLAESFVAAGGPTGKRGDGLEVVLHADLATCWRSSRRRPPSPPAESHGAGRAPTSAGAVRELRTGPGGGAQPSGQPLLTATALRRMCEDSVRVFLTDPDGRPLDLGRRVRHATEATPRSCTYRHDGHCGSPAAPNAAD